MWRDIGMGEWLFDFDHDAEVSGLVPAMPAMAQDPIAARAKVTQAGRLCCSGSGKPWLCRQRCWQRKCNSPHPPLFASAS